MADRDQMADMARKFLDLWQDQAQAMAKDPELERMCRTWLEFWTSPQSVHTPRDADETDPARPPPAAAAAGGGIPDMDAFARRLRHLEERVTALELGAGTGKPAPEPGSSQD